MKKIFLLFILSSTILLGQNSFKVDFDYSRFNYDTHNSYIEVYYSFYQPDLIVDNKGLIKSVKGILNVMIKHKGSDSAIVNQNYQFLNTLTDTGSSELQKKLTGTLGFVVPIGEYELTLTGLDGNDSTRVFSSKFNLKVSALPPDNFSISDIQLATSIRESDNQSSVFYKNTYEVIPNPSNIYGEQLPIVFFYTELYNTDFDIRSDLLQVEHILLDANNQVRQKKIKLLPRKTKSIVEVGTINITKLPTGSYLLVVAVKDSMKNAAVYSSKKLFIYNPSVIDTSTNVIIEQDAATSEFASMSEEELDEVFNYSKYIATQKELDQWKVLTEPEGKKTFMFNFWKGRDIDLSTPGNEFKRDYFNRVTVANTRYSTIQKKGWKTDRGRVFLSVGEPSEVERYPNQTDTRPYEIWYYNELEGGVIFVFADLTGFSDYQLVHSTMRGELRDDNWTRRIMVQ